MTETSHEPLTFTRPNPFDAELIEGPPIRAASPGGNYAETLEEMGKRLIQRVAEAAVGKGIDLPSRQAFYMAPIPADCEQVAALFTGWNPWPIQDGPTICQPWRWLANFSVLITRCTPAVPGKAHRVTGANSSIKTVSVAQLEAAAKLASDDAEVLLAVVNSLVEIGADTSIVTNAPSGGYQTVELNVPLISGGSI
jgi:hypothetical protein